MIGAFRKLLDSQKLRIDEAALKQDDAFIRAMIHYDIDVALFGIDEAKRNLVAKDPQSQFALQQFAEAERLNALGKRRTSRGAVGQQ
jgi:hypothetical protein